MCIVKKTKLERKERQYQVHLRENKKPAGTFFMKMKIQPKGYHIKNKNRNYKRTQALAS